MCIFALAIDEFTYTPQIFGIRGEWTKIYSMKNIHHMSCPVACDEAT